MMITYTQGNTKFNYRVAGIILSKDKKKILLNGADDIDFYVLPGGRVELLEDSKFALEREIVEELGEKVKIGDLVYFGENFFDLSGFNYHEINITYLVELDEHSSIYDIKDNWHGIEQLKGYFKWLELDKLEQIKLYPTYLKEKLKDVSKIKFEHIIEKK